MRVKRDTLTKHLAHALVSALTTNEAVVLASAGSNACNQSFKAIAVASNTVPCAFHVVKTNIVLHGVDTCEVDLVVQRAPAPQTAEGEARESRI